MYTVRTTFQYSNMGLSFNRSTWHEILTHKNIFCKIDKVDWDNALQYIFTNKINGQALTPRGPRVLHAGRCGMHFWQFYCDPTKNVTQIRKIVANASDKLYPKHLHVENGTIETKHQTGYGGWGDPRDHAFCLGIGTIYL